MYYYSWGADPTNEAGPSAAGVDDKFNTELDDFLRDDEYGYFFSDFFYFLFILLSIVLLK